MTPLLDKSAAMNLPAAPPSLADVNSPEALARATAQLRALGVDDEVIFTARTPEELFAYVDLYMREIDPSRP